MTFLLVCAVAFSGAFVYGIFSQPFDADYATPSSHAVVLEDRTGATFATIAPPELREPIAYDQIAPVMVQSITAAEDANFFQHGGIDPKAILRAILKDTQSGEEGQGGSTITQQYVKNVYTDKQKTYLRKIREAALAVRLDNEKGKTEILRLYLNSTYFGNSAYGIQAAAKYYYDVNASQLDLAQASILAGLVPAPSAYNPVVSMEKAKERQLYVLNRMISLKDITSDQAAAALDEDVTPKQVGSTALPTIAPEYADQVAQTLAKNYGTKDATGKLNDDVIFDQGYKVQTGLDLDLQQSAIDAVKTVLPNMNDPEAAVVATDPKTGAVEAETTKVNYSPRDASQKIVDGADGKPIVYTTYQRGGVNLATYASRNSGSTVKPFTLAAAVNGGIATVDTVKYAPPSKSYPDPTSANPGNQYTIRNAADGGETGDYTLSAALAYSINTIYGPLAIDTVGLPKVEAVAQAAGFGTDPTIWKNDSSSLGIPVTPEQESAAYGIFENGGIANRAQYITGLTDVDGNDVPLQGVTAPVQVVTAATATSVAGAMAGVVKYGTAAGVTPKNLPAGQTVIGKTGTNQDYKNAWFTGCTQDLCVTVWMGYDQEANADGSPHSMVNVEGVGEVFGGTLPATIWKDTLESYYAKKTAVATPTVAAPTSTYSYVAPKATAPVVRQTRPSVTATASIPPSREPSQEATTVAPSTAPTVVSTTRSPAAVATTTAPPP